MDLRKVIKKLVGARTCCLENDQEGAQTYIESALGTLIELIEHQKEE